MGTNIQIVLEHDGLRVHVETIALVRLEQIEQIVHQIDQTHTEILERQIPFSVPVGVRNDAIILHILPFPLRRQDGNFHYFVANSGKNQASYSQSSTNMTISISHKMA